jgi:hypothetical protein
VKQKDPDQFFREMSHLKDNIFLNFLALFLFVDHEFRLNPCPAFCVWQVGMAILTHLGSPGCIFISSAGGGGCLFFFSHLACGGGSFFSFSGGCGAAKTVFTVPVSRSFLS